MSRPPRRLALHAAAVWCAILVLAFANGALRELLLIPAFGRMAGLVASGALLSAIVVVLALRTVRWIGIASDRHAIAVGGLWLAGTLAFEFGFGAWVQHRTIDQMLGAYRFEDGNVWPLVLVVIAAAPLATHRLRRAKPAGAPDESVR